jgi:hypothetical protein
VLIAVGAATGAVVPGAVVTVAVGVVFTSVFGLSTHPDKNAPISTVIRIIAIDFLFINSTSNFSKYFPDFSGNHGYE